MAIPLSETQIEKIKADFPGLSINQIAHKHGVGWITVKNIVAPSNGHSAARAKNGHRHAGGGKTARGREARRLQWPHRWCAQLAGSFGRHAQAA